MSDKYKQNLKLPDALIKKIKSDNEFNLRLCLHTGDNQFALEKKLKRNSKMLFLPKYIEFYKENGFEEFFENT